jgi:hypothetical protein
MVPLLIPAITLLAGLHSARIAAVAGGDDASIPTHSVAWTRPHRWVRGGAHGAQAGLADLLGEQDARVTSPEGGVDSVTATAAAALGRPWRPASAWYDQQPWDALFPDCQHTEWCDAMYPAAETARVQAALWAAQNPGDCAAARYLIMNKPFNSGLGSSLHIHMYMLSLALTDGRILVVADGDEWFFATPSLCGPRGQQGEGEGGAGDAQAGGAADPPPSYLTCFFKPTTMCGLPTGSAAHEAPALAAFGQADQYVRSPPLQRFAGSGFQDMAVRSATPGLAEFAGKPTSWWFAQLAKFVVRPTEHTLRHLVWPAQQVAFHATEGALPRPLAAMFIRAGDKGREAPLQSVAAHFAELAPIAARLGIKDVYVGSDSHARIAEALDQFGANYTIHFIQWQRPDTGLGMADVMHTLRSGWRMDQLVRLALADLFITIQADAFVGTLSSNWARLTDELRRANGKARVPYATPEGFLQAAGGGAKYTCGGGEEGRG